MGNMSRFEEWAKYSQLEKIKEFITELGYKMISDSSSQRQVFVNNDTVIIIKKNLENEI